MKIKVFSSIFVLVNTTVTTFILLAGVEDCKRIVAILINEEAWVYLVSLRYMPVCNTFLFISKTS